MSTQIRCTTENDPVPIVIMFARMFRAALTNLDYANKVNALRGTFALSSTTDPQALTITLSDGLIHILHGVSPAAGIIVHVNFSKMNEPGYRPRIEGLLRHPLLALVASRALSFPEVNWTNNAQKMWHNAAHLSDMPRALRIVSSDDQQEVTLGEGTPEVEISGPSRHLEALFAGTSVLVSDVVTGKLTILGSLKHLTVLSEVNMMTMMGELDG